MKKHLSSGIVVFLFLVSTLAKGQAFNISVWNQGLCNNSTAYAVVTATSPGAGSYSWTANSATCAGIINPVSNGLNVMITYPCCGIYTVSCFAYSAINPTLLVNGPISYTVGVSCNSAPTATILSSAPNASICSGSSVTFTANTGGAGPPFSYTWAPGMSNTSQLIVNPIANTCYNVAVMNTSACIGMASSCINVLPIYSISVSGNTVICSGAPASLSLSGGPSFIMQPGNITSTNPVWTPTTNMVYTLTCPAVAYPCPTTSNVTVLVLNSPNVTISGSSSTCAGSSVILTGSGNANVYMWSIGATTSSITVSPTSSTCYSLSGTNILTGCASMAVHCMTVLPSPTLSISGSNTVCLGSSVNFTANGANTFTWNTNPVVNTNTLSAIPTSSVNYMVYGTGTNGCVGSNNVAVTPNPNCAIVWPGDANRDGQVSNTDVLELGLAANNIGPARTPTSNAWTGQFANAWTGTVSTGWNQCHADCNGDGIINANDNTAIGSNFALTHSFRETGSASLNPDLQLVPSSTLVISGTWNKADLILGDAANPMSQLYGLAFDINYDQAFIQPDSIKLYYTASFLNATNQNIDFSKSIFANGKCYGATVRVDHNNVNGNGKVGEFWYKVKTNAANNSIINLSASNIVKIGNTGASVTLAGGGASVTVQFSSVGVMAERADLNRSLSFYPNPANKQLTMLNASGLPVHFTVIDILGQEIMYGEFVQSKTIDVSNLHQGSYFIRFDSNNCQVYKKLVVED